MGRVEQLIAAFGARGKGDRAAWKLDVLLDLGIADDPRVVPFLLAVFTDAAEPGAVRIDALRRLREASLTPDQRVAVAEAGGRVLTAPASAPADAELRLHAALALGDFADVRGVVAALGGRALDPVEPLELRYNAFTSLQRAGPTAECIAVLAALRPDETLGQTARGVLAVWSGNRPGR